MEKIISKVNVHSKLTVVSSKPTGPGLTQKLTSLDHAMGQHTIHLVFYYRVNPFKDGPFESDLANLRVTLSDFLCVYPKVTGRLGKREEDGNWEVKCNDAGVRVLRATVGITVDEWLRSADVDDEKDLTVWEDMPDDPSIWSPFRIQFNDFEGGGLAIGFSYTHLHADISSGILFLKSWAEMYRGESIHQLPVFDLPTHKSQSKIKSQPQNFEISKTKSQKTATVTFKFSDFSIRKNLSKMTQNATLFEFLLALFWMRIIKSSDTFYHKDTVSVCIDMRKNVNSLIPHGYFGNAVHFLSLSNESNEVDLDDMVNLVHAKVANLKHEAFLSVLDWLEMQKEKTGKYESPSEMYGPDLTFVSVEDFVSGIGDSDMSMYSVNFRKDEKPVHVSCRIGNTDSKGLILVTPSAEGGMSRTVTVTLAENDIDRLCIDEVISDFEPVVVMRGRTL